MRIFIKIISGFAILAVGLAGGFLANFLGGGKVGASNQPGVLKAQQFQLIDNYGKVRGGMITDQKGSTSLFLTNAKGNRVVEIKAGISETVIDLYTPNATPALRLESSSIVPAVSLFYPNGKAGVVLSVANGNVPGMALNGESIGSRVTLEQNSLKGGAALTFFHGLNVLCSLGSIYKKGSMLYLKDYTTGKKARMMAAKDEAKFSVRDDRDGGDIYSGLSIGPEGTELLLRSSNNSKLESSTSRDGSPHIEMVKDGVTVWSKP